MMSKYKAKPPQLDTAPGGAFDDVIRRAMQVKPPPGGWKAAIKAQVNPRLGRPRKKAR